MNRCYLTSLCVAFVVFAATGLARATPLYTCTELVGLTNGNSAAPEAQGRSQLSNGTVVGQSAYQYASPTIVPHWWLCSWDAAGNRTTIGDGGSTVWNIYGDGAGQYAASFGSSMGFWNGTSFPVSSNPNLGAGSGADLNGMSQNGLTVGDHLDHSGSGPAWAYDDTAGTYYSFGPTDAMAISANSSGNVVGADLDGNKGFIWNETSQSYSPIPSLSFAWGISDNSHLVAGENLTGKAAVYNTSTTSTSTYWSGSASFVNDNGLVVGNTDPGFYDYGFGSGVRAMAEIGGQQVDLTTAYAPNGVTFNWCEGVNDAGQILVWSLGTGSYGNRTFLLTPVPEPSAILLSGTGLLGLLAYAWRKRN